MRDAVVILRVCCVMYHTTENSRKVLFEISIICCTKAKLPRRKFDLKIDRHRACPIFKAAASVLLFTDTN